MSNPLGNFNVSGQCFISNYKPSDKPKKGTLRADRYINLWYDNNSVETGGKVTNSNLKNKKAINNFGSILNEVASLAGDDKSLEYCDIQKLSASKQDFIGKYGIKDIKTDITGENPSGSARFIFEDGRQLRVDFKLTSEYDDYNSGYKKESIKNRERGILNAKALEDKIKQLKNDEKLNKKCTIELEKDVNGAYTGFIRVKLNKEMSACDIRDLLSDKVAGSKFYNSKRLKEGSILKHNKDLLESCTDTKFTLSPEAYGRYDLLIVPEGKTLRIDINDFVM